jgi:hypothetical protein
VKLETTLLFRSPPVHLFENLPWVWQSFAIPHKLLSLGSFDTRSYDIADIAFAGSTNVRHINVVVRAIGTMILRTRVVCPGWGWVGKSIPK